MKLQNELFYINIKGHELTGHTTKVNYSYRRIDSNAN